MIRTERWSRGVSVLAVTLVLVATACGGAASDGEAAPTDGASPESSTTVAGDETTVPDEGSPSGEYMVGTCYQLADPAEPDTSDPVDCEEPHDSELYATVASGTDPLTDDTRPRYFPSCIEAYSELTGEAIGTPMSLNVAYILDGSIGSPPESDVACFASTSQDDLLLGSLQEASPVDLMDGYVRATTLTPGDCFELSDQPNLARPVECDAETLRYVGAAEAPEGDFPGVEEIKVMRTTMCGSLFADSDLPGDPDEVSGTGPGEIEWIYQEYRVFSCDVPVPTR